MIGSGFLLIGGCNLCTLEMQFFSAPGFKFSTPLVLPFMFFSSRLICFSILRMTKVNVPVLKKSETNFWISMKTWWLTVVNSLFCHNLYSRVNTMTKGNLGKEYLFGFVLNHRSKCITEWSQGQNPSKNLKKLQGCCLLTSSGLCLASFPA